MLVGFSVSILTVTVATGIGLVSGYYRRVDMILMRIVDGVMSIPGLLLAIALMAIFGASIQNVVIVLTITATPAVIRLVRSQVLSLREQAFVEAAKSIGANPIRILRLQCSLRPSLLSSFRVPTSVPAPFWWKHL